MRAALRSAIPRAPSFGADPGLVWATLGRAQAGPARALGSVGRAVSTHIGSAPWLVAVKRARSLSSLIEKVLTELLKRAATYPKPRADGARHPRRSGEEKG
jgi:hypothetical protein